MGTYSTTIAGEPIDYEVRHSERADRARIDVGLQGVTVVVPAGSDMDPEGLLREKASWVTEKCAEYDEYREALPDRSFAPGEEFPYLGEPHELVIEARQQSVVEDGILKLRRSAVVQSSIETALRNVYRRQAREHFTERLDTFAAEMGVTYDELQIRNQSTRWGSCSTNRTISMNYRLLMAPPEIVDYVLIHELAHLEVRDHSAEFWALVEKYDAEYEDHAAWLEEHSTELIFTVDDL